MPVYAFPWCGRERGVDRGAGEGISNEEEETEGESNMRQEDLVGFRVYLSFLLVLTDDNANPLFFY